ncbi:TetR/AcrR family transcriptional regulator [Nocardia goodfellowii]
MKRRGNGPRQQDTIFATALELLSTENYDGLTMESIADRSGVNKTTLYRWWPSKDALLAAALEHSELLALTTPDTGTLRGDLLELTNGIHRLLTDSQTAPIATAVLAATPSRPPLAAIGRAFFAGRLERERPVFERAVARGELPPTVDPALIMDLLAGAIWFRLLLRGESVSPEYLHDIIDLALPTGTR